MKFMVYGTLKRNHGNNRILREGKATYVGKAVTLKPFVMAGFGVPYVWPHEQGYPLVGEVWDIGNPLSDERAAETLHNLDRLEGNGFYYNRVEHAVRMLEDAKGILTMPRDQGEEHDVWIYESMSKSLPTLAQARRWINPQGYLEWT